MRHIFLLLIIGFSFFCCTEAEKETHKMIPSDYLFAQRAFPHGKVDVKAYRMALDERQNRLSHRSSFDEPWTSEGPINICGRVTDLEMPEGDTSKIYAGTASGGIFLSEDKGNSWRSLFDGQPTMAIGDLAISKTNTDIIYAGTGESNAGGGSLAYDGLGVFRSDDGGDTWQHSGLENAGSIGRIAIHPQDDDIAYVAAMGALFKLSLIHI